MIFSNILILAGGDGTRFWPLKEKNVFHFLGKPLIEYQLRKLDQYGKKIYVIANEANFNQLNWIFKSISLAPKAIVIKQKSLAKGQADAILSAANYVDGDTLILNANDIFDYGIFEEFSGEHDNIKILVKKVKKYFPGGYLKFNQGRVVEILEKPDPNKTPSDMVKLVADYIPNIKELIILLKKTKTNKDDLYERALSKLIKNNKTEVIQYSGKWMSLKYPWDILPLTENFLDLIKENNFDSSSPIPNSSIIIGPVLIGKNVKIGDFVKIVGPVYIGENTIIGDHSLIRKSHIGTNVLIGSGCEVARSYISDNVKLHRNYVGDSVLDKYVLMGAGAVIANFRFDERKIISSILDKSIDTNLDKLGAIIGEKSKIGVNVTILPGKKISCNSQVYPGKTVDQDIR